MQSHPHKTIHTGPAGVLSHGITISPCTTQASSLLAQVAHRAAEANMLATSTARVILVVDTIDVHAIIATVETGTTVVAVRGGELCLAQAGCWG